MAVRADKQPEWNGDGPRDAIVVRRRNVGRALALFVAGIVGLFLVGLFAVWLERKPIANNVIGKELARRGVRATYHLDRIGLRTQRISNLVIGNPAHPDLIAKSAQVEMRILLNGGVEVYRIEARGVRLRATYADNKVSFGDVDRLLPKPTTTKTSFKFPDIAIDLADTAIALRTPYGPMGFAVLGQGNLTGGFKGQLAVSSAGLAFGRCGLNAVHAAMRIEIVRRRPHVVGPFTARKFVCLQSNLAMASPRLDLDSNFSESFGSFDGNGRLSTPTLLAGANGLANLVANVGFKGTPASANGTIDLGARQARLGQVMAGSTHLKGRYRLAAAKADLALVADYDARGATLPPSMLASISGPLAAAAKTPIGPIVTAIGQAVTGTASGFDARGSLRVVNFPGGGAVRIETADVSGPNGARARIAGRDGVTYYWPANRIRIDSQIATQGGGLPTARIDLHQPRGFGPASGIARVAPYAVNGASLALDPVNFAAARDGSTRLSTTALLTGPFAGGSVTGLRIPIEGSLGGSGGLSFGHGCLDTSFQALKLGAMRLNAAKLPVCPLSGGAIVAQRPGGPLNVGLVTNRVQLGGMLGSSPVQIAAARARLLDLDRFDASDVGMRLGKPESPVLIRANALTGRFGKDITGNFTGGSGTIGNIPLAMSAATGRFSFAKALTVDGALTLSDGSEKAKFYPLAARGVHFVLAGDRITTTGALHNPATGALVTNVDILHLLSSGTGHATLDVPGLRFSPALQPEQITPLTEGVVALVNGTITGQGRINWNGTNVTSTGDFSTEGTDLAAAFGPVTGIRGTIHFDDLLGLSTPPGQSFQIATINPGILVEHGSVQYQLLPGQLVRVQRGQWPFMGGQLSLRETILNFAKSTPKRLTFEIDGLDAKTLITSFDFKEIGADGIFDGVLPMIFDESGGRIVGGRLDSRPPGGALRYNGVVNKANLGLFGGIAFNALRDLRFKKMIVRLDGDLAGEFATTLVVDEVALGNTGTQRIIRRILKKVPFKFNVSIKGPFRALIGTAKSFKDPRATIHDALPEPLGNLPDSAVQINVESGQSQTQTPVKEDITMTKKPAK